MGAFDNATLVEPEDNTTLDSNTPTNFFANAFEVIKFSDKSKSLTIFK